MGGNSSGNKGDIPEDWSEKDTSYKGKIKNVRGLVTMKDPQMYKATKEAISRFYAATGAIERNIKIADLSGSVMGIGTKGEVYLNGSYFDRKDSRQFVENSLKRQYKEGWQTQTNKPISHVISHEIAHSVWQQHHTSANAQAAGQVISNLYKEWRKDKKKTGYGAYSKSNIDEFWAETVTKAVSGKSDKYTRAAKAIITEYKL